MIKNIFFGLVFIAIGAGLTYYFVLMPLQDIEAGRPVTEIFKTAVFVGPFIAVIGLGYIVATLLSKATGGDQSKPLMQQGRAANLATWLFFLLAAGAGAYALFEWFPAELAKLNKYLI